MTRLAGADAAGLLGLVPKAVLSLALAAWLALGIMLTVNAPFASGTDESIRYVAFSAAKNRWATAEDFRDKGIDHFYYPPLYFLCFAPFYDDDPAFVDEFPVGEFQDKNYANLIGRAVVSRGFLSRVPPSLDRLYRAAKLFSVSLGLVVLLSLVATLRLLFQGRICWWLVALGTAPLLFLPQFLYYHTLCNNDALVNALSALAILAFVSAIVSLEERRRGRFVIFSLLTAAAIGLGILSKMSAFTTLPLLPGLALALASASAAEPALRRVRSAFLLLSALILTTIASGGWWVLYKAAQGDWDSMKAHRLAHPWAFGQAGMFGSLQEQLIAVARSYYALFNGMLYISVPDIVISGYFLIPAAAFAALILLLACKRPWRYRSLLGDPRLRLRVILWGSLAAVVVSNGLLIFMYISKGVDGAYGRLLFPSLVASHAIFVGLLSPLLSQRLRWSIIAGVLTAGLGGILFWWTYTNRLLDAVSQPEETIEILSPPSSPRFMSRQIGASRVEQPLLIPPGVLTGFRIRLIRSSQFPQIGAALTGSLQLYPSGAIPHTVPLLPAALGDSDNCRRWIDVRLGIPINLSVHTAGTLVLKGRSPFPAFSFVEFSYALAKPTNSSPAQALRWNGRFMPVSLNVAAVYGSDKSR